MKGKQREVPADDEDTERGVPADKGCSGYRESRDSRGRMGI